MRKLMIACLLISSLAVSAQRGPRGGNERMPKNLTAEQTATLQTKKMTLTLALDENQSAKVYDLLLQEAIERKANKTDRERTKEEAVPTKDEHYAIANKRLDHQIAMQNKMKDILTEEQFAKFEKIKMKRKAVNKRKRRRHQRIKR